jgi:hypothetical protein
MPQIHRGADACWRWACGWAGCAGTGRAGAGHRTEPAWPGAQRRRTARTVQPHAGQDALRRLPGRPAGPGACRARPGPGRRGGGRLRSPCVPAADGAGPAARRLHRVGGGRRLRLAPGQQPRAGDAAPAVQRGAHRQLRDGGFRVAADLRAPAASRQAVPGGGSCWVGRLRRLPCGPRTMGVPQNSLRSLAFAPFRHAAASQSTKRACGAPPIVLWSSATHKSPPPGTACREEPWVACGRVVRHPGLQGPGPACAGLRVRRRGAQGLAGCGSPQGDPSSESCPRSGSWVGCAAARPGEAELFASPRMDRAPHRAPRAAGRRSRSPAQAGPGPRADASTRAQLQLVVQPLAGAEHRRRSAAGP